MVGSAVVGSNVGAGDDDIDAGLSDGRLEGSLKGYSVTDGNVDRW